MIFVRAAQADYDITWRIVKIVINMDPDSCPYLKSSNDLNWT